MLRTTCVLERDQTLFMGVYTASNKSSVEK